MASALNLMQSTDIAQSLSFDWIFAMLSGVGYFLGASVYEASVHFFEFQSIRQAKH